MTLFEIAEREGTDKSSHGYCPFYETLLAQYIDRECTLLEMGIGSGASLKTWRQWLPKSKIVGLEQDEPTCERCKSDDYEVVLGNQSNVKDLQRLVQGRFFAHMPRSSWTPTDSPVLAGFSNRRCRLQCR